LLERRDGSVAGNQLQHKMGDDWSREVNVHKTPVTIEGVQNAMHAFFCMYL
jgi:hypothetical protein